MPTPPSSAPPPAPPHVSRARRHWGSAVALVVLAAIIALAWYLTHRPAPATGPGGAPPAAARAGGGPGAAARGAPPSSVGVATAQHANIPVYIDALGTVTPLAVANVSPQVSGVITEILYKEGQLVKKGEALATIDPRPFQAAVDQASAARARDVAQLNAAKVQLERYQTLLKQDSIARQTVDTQEALVKQLTGTVAVDQANEATARLNLQWSHIVAPIGGRVGLRPIDVGNYINAGNATGVATITQIMPIDVQFSIPQERVPDVKDRVASGAKLPVSAWDSGRTRKLDEGDFLTLDNQIDVQTGTVKAKARFDNKEGTLFPNQFVNVRLLLRTIDAAVVVPVNALRHGPSGDFVYVVNGDHTVSLRNVTAGVIGVDNVEITKGLAVGEVVVTEGGDRLKDGARIQTGAERPAAASPGTPGVEAGAGGNGSRSRSESGAHRGARSEGAQQAPASPSGNAPASGSAPQASQAGSPTGGAPSPPGVAQTPPTGEATGPATANRAGTGTTRARAAQP
jgi:membrane fusion protein, multidrug efflux system